MASQNTKVPKCRPKQTPIHLLVVLGSGGHTAEMFNMLSRMQLDPSMYSYRTYVVSSGDKFSAVKAVEFEKGFLSRKKTQDRPEGQSAGSFSIATVPRARRVHQSYLTAPFSTLQCLYACLLVLCNRHIDQSPLSPNFVSPYPDLILTNGPATAVCVILAARLLRFYHCLPGLNPLKSNRDTFKAKTGEADPRDFQMRAIFVESWARVTTLSLSGKLLLPFVDRFLVQWPALEGKTAWEGMKKTEYVGPLVG